MKSAIFAVLAAAAVNAAPAEAEDQTPARHFTRPYKVDALDKIDARARGDSPWGGTIQEGNGWTYVTGTAKVPSVTGQSSHAGAAAWVGIDGYKCQHAILQTGFTAFGDGHLEAWYEWYPEPSYTYDLDITAGDELRMTVHANGARGGNSTVENLTTGKSASHQFSNMRHALCLSDAEWIVEDFQEGTQSVPFADFGEIDFTAAEATSPEGTVTPDGDVIVEVTVDGEDRTSCSANSSGVECKYI